MPRPSRVRIRTAKDALDSSLGRSFLIHKTQMREADWLRTFLVRGRRAQSCFVAVQYTENSPFDQIDVTHELVSQTFTTSLEMQEVRKIAHLAELEMRARHRVLNHYAEDLFQALSQSPQEQVALDRSIRKKIQLYYNELKHHEPCEP